MVQELRRLQDLVEISSPGSVVLKADLRLGKSTSRMAPQTRHPGNAQLPLDLLVDQRLGSVLVDTVATVNTVEAATVVPHHGSSPEAMTEVKTTTADTVVDKADMVDTAVEEEATARVHLLEAPLHGCSRKHTQVTAPLEWTTTAFRRHLHRLLPAFHLRPLLAICRRPRRHRPSSCWQSPILTILEQKHGVH